MEASVVKRLLLALALLLPTIGSAQAVCSITSVSQAECSATALSETTTSWCVCATEEAAGPFGGHATLTDGLVSAWKLDEESGTRVDAHGSNDLTDNNTVGFAAGQNGNAASFVAANSESLSLGSGITALDDTFTVAMWLNVGAATRFAVLQNGSGAGTFGFGVECSVFAAGDVFVVHHDAGTDFSYTAGGVITTDGSAFQLVIITYDTGATPKLHVYVNDVDKALTLGPSFPVLGIGAAFNLGRRPDASRFFTGKQDEVLIYSRVLTAQERTDLFAGGAGLPY